MLIKQGCKIESLSLRNWRTLELQWCVCLKFDVKQEQRSCAGSNWAMLCYSGFCKTKLCDQLVSQNMEFSFCMCGHIIFTEMFLWRLRVSSLISEHCLEVLSLYKQLHSQTGKSECGFSSIFTNLEMCNNLFSNVTEIPVHHYFLRNYNNVSKGTKNVPQKYFWKKSSEFQIVSEILELKSCLRHYVKCLSFCLMLLYSVLIFVYLLFYFTKQ